MAAKIIETSGAAQQLAGKHLTFVLGREHYGVPVLKVREIIRLCDITPVPQMPEYIKGVLNLRGKIIPVIDLRERFGMTAKASTKDNRNCIVVVETQVSGGKHSTGLIVDAVNEVCEIKPQQVEEKVELGARVSSDYITGIAKINNQVIILLNIEKVLSAEAVGAIHETAV